MLYDAMQYVAQVESAAKTHRRNSVKPATKSEFLSGFYNTDRLFPVITLTLYFGADKWTVPIDLHGMLSADADIIRFIDNYHLHLIAPAQIADKDFEKFHTELGLALNYIKASKNKEELNELVHRGDSYKSVSRKTADLVNIVTGSGLNYYDGEENVNMCFAIEEMRNDALRQGRMEGIEQRIEKGIEQGIEKGMEDGYSALLSALLIKVCSLYPLRLKRQI